MARNQKFKFKLRPEIKSEEVSNDGKASYEGAIAIDLGTTNSVIGYLEKLPDGTVVEKMLKNKDGGELTPSFIEITSDPDDRSKLIFTVGEKAKQHMSINPENVVCSYKTKMGLPNPDNIVKEVKYFGTKKPITAEFCSMKALEYLKESAEYSIEKETGRKELVNRAIITVPARFGQSQRDATRMAAKRAGLDVIRLLDEPSAAAYYYLYHDKDIEGAIRDENNNIVGQDGKEVKSKAVLVYDLGGGTFDISFTYISGVICGTEATKGLTHLGGDNFDEAIASWLYSQIVANTAWEPYHKKLNGNIPSFERLKEHNYDLKEKLVRQAEKMKIKISQLYTEQNYSQSSIASSANTKVEVSYTFTISNQILKNTTTRRNIPEDTMEVTLTSTKLKELLQPMINQTMVEVENLFNTVTVNNNLGLIDEIILVGGSSKLPFIWEEFEKFIRTHKFNDNPNLQNNINKFDRYYFQRNLYEPDYAVCYGARKYLKAYMENKTGELSTKLPNPVGVVLQKRSEYNQNEFKPEFRVVLNTDISIPVNKLFWKTLDNLTLLNQGEQKEAIFKVQEGNYREPEKNKTIGIITLPVPEDLDKPANYTVSMRPEIDGSIKVKAKDTNTGITQTSVFKTIIDESSFSLQGVEPTTTVVAADATQTQKKGVLKARKKKTSDSSTTSTPKSGFNTISFSDNKN